MWIKPRILVQDESEFWDKDIIDKAGKIYGIYLYDSEYRVHICSFQSSNEIYALGFEIKECVDDDTYDLISRGWSDGTTLIGYKDTYSFGGVYEFPNSFPLKTIRCKKDERDDIWEDIVEGYREGFNTGNLDVYGMINKMEKENE